MRIAVPANEDKKTVCISYGRAPFFMIEDTEKGSREFEINPGAEAEGGAGIKAAQKLLDLEADVLLTPRCGENAVEVLRQGKVEIYKTTSDNLDDEIAKYKNGELETLTEVHKGLHHS